VFQLEEGEILTEPVPARENRRGILAFEATEGGAGVLGRLTSDPSAVANVTRAALALMHYRDLDAAIASADPALLVENEDVRCVKGCYRCLLSYYNQPDHEQIDRTDNPVRTLLLRLARSQVGRAQRAKSGNPEPQSDWYTAITRWGLPAPDVEPLTVNGTIFPMAWHAHLTAASIGTVDPQTRAEAEALGYTIAVLPDTPGEQPPVELVTLLGAMHCRPRRHGRGHDPQTAPSSCRVRKPQRSVHRPLRPSPAPATRPSYSPTLLNCTPCSTASTSSP
jgi:hypothetical protein